MSFTRLKSYAELQKLAKNPFDLTKEGALSPKRVDTFIAEAMGLKLFYGTERVDESVMKALFALAEETQALKKMDAMQAGEIVNFIEGHLPKIARPSIPPCATSSNTAILPLLPPRRQQLAYKELEKLRDFLNEIEKKIALPTSSKSASADRSLGRKPFIWHWRPSKSRAAGCIFFRMSTPMMERKY